MEAVEIGAGVVGRDGEGEAETIDKNHQTDSCAESDSPAAGANGRHELSDDYVAFILAMPREPPLDTEDIPFMTTKYDLAKLLNRSEEWVEEQRQWFREDAARDQEIYDHFVPFQDWVRDEFFNNGHVEVDEEYLSQVAELEEYGRGLWDDLVEKRGGFAGVKFADPNDPRYAGFYE